MVQKYTFLMENNIHRCPDVSPTGEKMPSPIPSWHVRHLLGLPKNHVPKSLPLGCGPQYVLPGGLGHLQVPWESFMGPKLKIYVETICCEHFVFYEEKMLVANFWDFVW